MSSSGSSGGRNGAAKCDSDTWFELAFAAIAVIYVLVILAFYEREIILYRSRKDVKRLTKFLKIGTLAVFTLYALAASSSLGFVLPLCVAEQAVPNQFNIVMGCCYGTGLLILITTFIHRFGLVVEGSSIFKPQHLKYIVWYIWGMVGFMVLFTLITLILFLLESDDWIYLFEAAGSFYIIFSFSMLSLFLYSLFQLARLLGASKDAKMQKKLTSLVDSMTSYTILVTVGLLSSLTWGSAFAFGGLDSDIALCSDIFINSICLYMQFPFAKRLYSIVCKPCHTGTQRLFWGSMNQKQRDSIHLSAFSPRESPHMQPTQASEDQISELKKDGKNTVYGASNAQGGGVAQEAGRSVAMTVSLGSDKDAKPKIVKLETVDFD